IHPVSWRARLHYFAAVTVVGAAGVAMVGRSNGVAHERASSRWWAPSSALLWQGEAPLVRGRACGMMVMVPFLLGGTFFLDETTERPARPLRSGFLFARGEPRRRPRVELTGDARRLDRHAPRAEPPVAGRPKTSPGPGSLLSGRGFSVPPAPTRQAAK